MTSIRQVEKAEEDYIRKNFEYDPGTGDLWRKFKNGEKKKCKRQDSGGYYRVGIGKKKFMVHRICYFLGHDFFPKKEIDHRDRDRTNNKIDNLHQASHEENARNRSKLKTYNGNELSSKYKGVHARKVKGKFFKWVAQIVFEGQKIHIGYFNKEVEAALAYDREALKLFGKEFVNLNFPHLSKEDLCEVVKNDEANFSDSIKFPLPCEPTTGVNGT